MKKSPKAIAEKQISEPIWKQHTTWMNIMKEGSLTGTQIKRHKDSLSVKK